MTVGSLLSGSNSFTIPPFQRSYAWTEREVGQLLADIWQAMDEERERPEDYGGMFLGSMVVIDPALKSRAATAGKPRAFQVVDGKQRLTTLTILLAELRQRLGSSARWIDEMLALVTNENPDDRDIARLILPDRENAQLSVLLNGPDEARATSGFDEEETGGVQCLNECQLTIAQDLEDRDEADLQAMAEFVREAMVLTIIGAADIDSAYRVFLSTNHRGKPLESTDIIKAELVSGLPEAQRTMALERWHTVELLLGADFTDLPAYLHTLYGRTHGGHIEEVMALSRRQGSTGTFLNDTLFPLAYGLYPILKAAHMGSPQSAGINRNLRMLGWLKSRDWVPPVLAFTQIYPDDPDRLFIFLTALERLAFVMQIMGIGGEQRAARYRAIVAGLRSGMPIDGSQEPLSITAAEQGEFLLKANGGLYDRSAATCKYLLKRISASYPSDTVIESLSDVSVEHVLPSKPGRNSQWLAEIPDADERVACSNLLGNFALISREQNKEAKNLPLEAKLKVIFPGGERSIHAITNDLIGAKTWNAAGIRARDKALTGRLRDIVGIPLDIGPSRRKRKPKA